MTKHSSASLKLAALPRMALIALGIAVKPGVLLRLAVSITLASAAFISVSAAQQSSAPATAPGDPSAATTDGNVAAGKVSTQAAETQTSGSGDGVSLYAHCYCAVGRSDNGSIVQSFGALPSPYGINDKKNRTACQNNCQVYVENWGYSNPATKTQVCTDFYEDGVSTLEAFWHMGTDNYAGSAQNIYPTDSRINYPMTCGPQSAITAQYAVTNLTYGPPGCTPNSAPGGYNCKPGSYVQYTGSTAGSMSTTLSSSVASAYTLSVTLNPTNFGGIIPISVGGGASGNLTSTTTQGTSETVSKTSSFSLLWPPGGLPISNDGLNHDDDLITILTNPGAIFVTWNNPFNQQRIVTWTLGYRGPIATILNLPVGGLRCLLGSTGGYALMALQFVPCGPTDVLPPNIVHDLTVNLGLTVDDFYNIATIDPYWNYGTYQIPQIPGNDPRYTLEPIYSFPYGSPFLLDGDWDCPDDIGQTISNQTINTSTVGDTKSYAVGYTVTAGIPNFLNFTGGKTITWTNTVSQQNMTTRSNSAFAYVGCASVNWGNSATNYDEVYPYYDVELGTFMFYLGYASQPPPGAKLVSSGQVLDSFGQPAPGLKLELVYATATYGTFSDSHGNFHFYSRDDLIGPATAQLSVIGPGKTVTETVSVGASTTVALPSPFRSWRPPFVPSEGLSAGPAQ
jgi:hypothetical protein